ncbi:hypothetical protein K491DRAFT_695845 [Lophiostoma macrostomum CBS 122681]|uniref:Uncharacterized protein n=1 Tax=Lophiostoma macrostomum CBS 122681 TaxID=1314788 RepID=A0A6A6SX19_9PLEO|nr:hypothetical protein K491DRAFT_695845 [Lophiostoma macrostomum CBS 122681]
MQSSKEGINTGKDGNTTDDSAGQIKGKGRSEAHQDTETAARPSIFSSLNDSSNGSGPTTRASSGHSADITGEQFTKASAIMIGAAGHHLSPSGATALALMANIIDDKEAPDQEKEQTRTSEKSRP